MTLTTNINGKKLNTYKEYKTILNFNIPDTDKS